MDQRPGQPRERRWRGHGQPGGAARPSRALLVALVLAAVSLMTLDHAGGSRSPLEPARRVVGEMLAPAQAVTTAAVRPFTSVSDRLRTRSELQGKLDLLAAENAELRQQVRTADLDRNRLAALDGLTRAAVTSGHAIVPARVIAVGPSQSFSQTVTIDAGSRAGLGADMTVLDNDGLVGRVLRVTRESATVLLAVDADSTVGGRLGESMEMGFVRGQGRIDDTGLLDLALIDDAVVPARGDVVVTWGSRGGAPYVSGVPIGEVTRVWRSLRDSSHRAVIEPFVDFSALDLVGVVVPSGTESDRAVIEADGSLR